MAQNKKSPTEKLTPADLTPIKKDDGLDGLDVVVDLIARFGRFVWDILGATFLALSIMTALALAGLIAGTVLTPWATFLWHWLGWGSTFIVFALLWVGVWLLRRRNLASPFRLSLFKILAWEGAAFSLLALLSVLGGNVLLRAEAGMDGGLVGWGLAYLISQLFPPVLSIVLLGVLFLFFIWSAFGLDDLLERWLGRYLTADEQGPTLSLTPQRLGMQPPLMPNEFVEDEMDGEQVEPPIGKTKPAIQLPGEYRKSFRIPPKAVEKPNEPLPRNEALPPLNLLIGEQSFRPDERHINLTAGLIEKTLAEFGVPARVVGFRIGPTVTQFAVEPGFVEKPGAEGEPVRQKIRVSQISALSRDLALALSAERLRIEAPVPGRSYVGIEVPNIRSTIVRLRPLLESEAFYRVNAPLAIALGRDVSGQPMIADLSRMPHLLIAGTTGSGKSVCIAAITACLVMSNTPEDLRLVMIDPKMVELVRFNGIPHMYGKVETELERILAVLRWSLMEMDQRYRLFETVRARDIESYNRKMQKRKQPTLPRIVLVIDELADLMMTAPDQTEHSLVRLAQMARATGIHLVVATQRPSTDVVTGLIKANFPARISFTVASSIDSRVILDTPGAETLLGKGDMLFVSAEIGTPIRAQGVFVTDQEVEKIITFWQKMSPSSQAKAAPWEAILNENEENGDSMIEQAITIVRQSRRASASLLQRRLRIGYPRAARLVDELEELGIVGPSQGGGREREVLIEPTDEDDDELDMEG